MNSPAIKGKRVGKRKRRVLVIAANMMIPCEGYGGIQRVVDVLCTGLVNENVDVALLAGYGSKSYGGLLMTCSIGRGTLLERVSSRALFQAQALRGGLAADIIHSFTCWPESQWMAGRLGVPVVLHWQNLLSKDEVSRSFKYLPCLRKIVGISDDQICDKGRPGQFSVIYNPVVPRLFSGPPSRGREYLVFLGRLTYDKGVDIAIDIALRTGLRLKIAGPVPSEEKDAREFFERRVRSRLSDRIEWLGEVSDVEKVDLFSGAIACLFPIRWREPFGIVMAESLACGVPVIGSRRGSVPEVIRHGITGFVCDSVDEMIAAVGAVEGLSRDECRMDAAARFSPSAFMGNINRLYRSVNANW